MGLFDIFRKKRRANNAVEVINNLVDKYFGGRTALNNDARELLKETKFDVSEEILAFLMAKCLGYISLNTGWTSTIANSLKRDSQGNISQEDLKWLMVYVDLHYVHKNPTKEAMLLFELSGRNMGMPSPSGNISTNYKFEKI